LIEIILVRFYSNFNEIELIFLLLQSLERCQLKEVVAAKPEKLEASGDHLNSSHKSQFFNIFLYANKLGGLKQFNSM